MPRGAYRPSCPCLCLGKHRTSSVAALGIVLSRPVVVAWHCVDPTVGRPECLHLSGGRHGDWERLSAGQCRIADDGPATRLTSPQRGEESGRANKKAFRNKSRLADWQVKAAKKYLNSRLSEPVTIADVAGACRLSQCYFIRAFTETVGTAPYAWLIEQRIRKACLLIGEGELPLAQIALECGFVDQSHLTKAFARQTGMTPARWRHARSALSTAN